MKTLTLGCYALGVCTAIAFLAACGSGGSQVSPATLEQSLSGSLASMRWNHDTSGFARSVRSGTSSPCVSPPCIYASAYDGPGKSYAGRLNIFAGDANGNVPPLAHIKGVRAGLYRPTIAVDSNRNLYAANLSGNNVTVYAAETSGDVKPIRTIAGSATHIDQPTGIAVDGSGRIYVSNADVQAQTYSITVFAAGANGNASPIQWIRGSKTQLYYPTNVTVDQDNNIYATNDNAGHGTVTIYASGTNGNVSPIETIGGSRTRMWCAAAVALDSSKRIYVANDCVPPDDTGSITVYAAGANGNAKPIQIIVGSQTLLDRPHGIALDPNNNVYVADYFSIRVYAQGSKGNVAPIRTISGAKTKLLQRIVSGVVVL